jgi:hypothetical protein
MNIPLTPPCRNRTAKQILAEIKKAVKAHPGAPVRMDVHQSEAAAITAAAAAMTAQGWGRVYHLHLDEQRDVEGWGRFVFLPPGMRPPPSNSPEIKSLCFSQDEIIRVASNSFMDHRVMAPDAERGRVAVRARSTGTASTREGAKNRAAEIRAVYLNLKKRPDNRGVKRCWLLDRTIEHFQKNRAKPRKGYGVRTVEKATAGL